jgi:hypothetical protein
MPESSVSSISIYQLRVVLCGVSPLVWRRLLVVSTTSIAELHEILRSAGVANICTASLFMARPMGFRVLGALSSGRMPDGCRFLVSVCIAASASAMNTTSWPIGSWTFGWSELCLLIPTALFHSVSVEAKLRRPKTALESWIILSGWIGIEATCPSRSLTSWLKPWGGFSMPMQPPRRWRSGRTA